MSSDSQLVFPFPAKRAWLDRLCVRLGQAGALMCNVCGRVSWARHIEENLRESVQCRRCGSKNRQRQLAHVTLAAVRELTGVRLSSLRALGRKNGVAIYNTENRGPIHGMLHTMPGYQCSEFLRPGLAGGTVIDGTRHENLMQLSFADNSFDLVLSTEVFEHIADPYRAHKEVLRVLRPRGRHVFTVPFDQGSACDDIRAVAQADGTIQYLAEPQYHFDPIKNESSALVYTIFGIEMVAKLQRIGFTTRVYQLHRRALGIIGENAIVFEAIKA